MNDAEDCPVCMQGNEVDDPGEPLFRPFVSDSSYLAPALRGQLEPNMRQVSRHASRLDDLLLQRCRAPASSADHAHAQTAFKLRPIDNMPLHHADHDASVDDVIDHNRSRPLFGENTRTGHQQKDASNERPSHELGCQDGDLPSVPATTLSCTRFWSISEQISLIDAVEKCLMQDKSWHREDRWDLVFAHMCAEGHDRRSVKKVKSKFYYLTKDYLSLRDWIKAGKSRASYEKLSSSQKRAKGLPFAFDKDLFQRMTHFYRTTKFDEFEKEEKTKSKGGSIKGGKADYTRYCGAILALRASPRFVNNKINTRNAKAVHDGHGNAEEAGINDDDGDNVHDGNDKHDNARDKDAVESEDDMNAEKANACSTDDDESDGDGGDEDGTLRGNQDKEAINKECTHANGIKERRPLKKPKMMPIRQRERHGHKHGRADLSTENLIGSRSNSNKEDMMYQMVTAMSQTLMIHAECLRHVLLNKDK